MIVTTKIRDEGFNNLEEERKKTINKHCEFIVICNSFNNKHCKFIVPINTTWTFQNNAEN